MKFYTTVWIREVLDFYQNSEKSFFIEGKEVKFSSEEFFFALVHIYSRDVLERLQSVRGNLVKEIKEKKGFDFMYLVDMLRKEFASWFRDLILSKNFSEEERSFLAKEFLLLEHQVREQIQIPILDELKKGLIQLEANLKENPSEVLKGVSLKKLERIYRFFNKVEGIEESLCSRLIKEFEDFIKKHISVLGLDENSEKVEFEKERIVKLLDEELSKSSRLLLKGDRYGS